MSLCPLCNQVVPYKRDQQPDIAMSAHIDRDCQSDPAEERRKKIFNHKCNMKNCKQKEVLSCFFFLLLQSHMFFVLFS